LQEYACIYTHLYTHTQPTQTAKQQDYYTHTMSIFMDQKGISMNISPVVTHRDMQIEFNGAQNVISA